MNILHTSDWHLGKKTEGIDRINEQKDVLEEICRYAETRDAEIILICGDIYDTYTPPAQAEDLFYNTVCRLSDGGKRLVVVIAGNHDDPVRLCAASALAQRHAIIISGGGGECFSFPENCPVKLLECGKGWARVLTAKGNKALLNFLAYPNDSRLGEISKDIDYSEKIAGYLKAGNDKFSDDTVNITLSHIFAAGALSSGEEREIHVGGIKVCGLSVFSDKCHYTALGHIHKYQKMGDNVFYSGSILKYSADEPENKFVLLSKVTEKGLESTEKLPLYKGKNIITYTADSFEQAEEFLSGTNDYVYLVIVQDSPLAYSQSKQLKSHPNLLSIELKTQEAENSQPAESRKNYSNRELFINYYISRYNNPPPDVLVNLFIEIMEGEQG